MCVTKAIIYSTFRIVRLCYTVSKECQYITIHLTIEGRYHYFNKIRFQNFPIKSIPWSY